MKGMKFWFLIFVFGISVCHGMLKAQNVEAVGTLSTDTIVPGEQFGMELNFRLPANFQVRWPVFADTLSTAVEILSRGATETSQTDGEGNKIMRQQFLLTSFDTGWLYIPAINIQFAPEGDTTYYSAQTNPLMLRVQPVAIDTTAAFKPIKDTEKVPLTFAEIYPWIIALHLIAALVFLVFWFLRRRKRKQAGPAEVMLPNIPPHQHALEQLEQLRHEKLWQQGQLKAYHTRLSDIIREYIEAAFPVNAVEMTTNEILFALKPLNINAEALNKLAASLELADMVKFAKAQPGAMENDMSLNHLIDFVSESYQSILPAGETEGKEDEA